MKTQFEKNKIIYLAFFVSGKLFVGLFGVDKNLEKWIQNSGYVKLAEKGMNITVIIGWR